MLVACRLPCRRHRRQSCVRFLMFFCVWRRRSTPPVSLGMPRCAAGRDRIWLDRIWPKMVFQWVDRIWPEFVFWCCGFVWSTVFFSFCSVVFVWCFWTCSTCLGVFNMLWACSTFFLACSTILFGRVQHFCPSSSSARTALLSGPPKISLFFHLPPHFSFFLPALGGLRVEFGGVFEAPAHPSRPTLQGPTPRGPLLGAPFFWVRDPILRSPTSGPHSHTIWPSVVWPNSVDKKIGQMRSNKVGQVRFGQMRSRPCCLPPREIFDFACKPVMTLSLSLSSGMRTST